MGRTRSERHLRAEGTLLSALARRDLVLLHRVSFSARSFFTLTKRVVGRHSSTQLNGRQALRVVAQRATPAPTSSPFRLIIAAAYLITHWPHHPPRGVRLRAHHPSPDSLEVPLALVGLLCRIRSIIPLAGHLPLLVAHRHRVGRAGLEPQFAPEPGRPIFARDAVPQWTTAVDVR